MSVISWVDSRPGKIATFPPHKTDHYCPAVPSEPPTEWQRFRITSRYAIHAILEIPFVHQDGPADLYTHPAVS